MDSKVDFLAGLLQVVHSGTEALSIQANSINVAVVSAGLFATAVKTKVGWASESAREEKRRVECLPRLGTFKNGIANLYVEGCLVCRAFESVTPEVETGGGESGGPEVGREASGVPSPCLISIHSRV